MFKKLFRSRLFLAVVGFVGVPSLGWGLMFLSWNKPSKKSTNKPPRTATARPTPFWGPSTNYPLMSGAGFSWGPGTSPAGNFPQVQLVVLINRHRQTLGLRTLHWHDGLATAAQLHSSDMAARNYYATVTPEGLDLPYRLTSAVPPIAFANGYGIVAQTNSLYSGADISQLFVSLLADPAASSALSYPGMTHIGIGYAQVPVFVGPWRWTIIVGQNVVP